MHAKAYLILARDAAKEWSNDRGPRMGAALAYYTTFSLAPLLLIATGIAGALFGEDAAQGQVLGEIEATVGSTAAHAIEDLLRHTSTPSGNILFTLLGLGI